MSEKEICCFNKTAVYNKTIAPIVAELMKACVLNDVPMFITCCVKSTEDETVYKNNTANSPVPYQIPLVDDQITKHVAICAGFAITPRNFSEELDKDLVAFMEQVPVEDEGNEEDES